MVEVNYMERMSRKMIKTKSDTRRLQGLCYFICSGGLPQGGTPPGTCSRLPQRWAS